MADIEFYRRFGAKVERLKTDFRDLLAALKADGKRIAVYQQASAKGSTLLNYSAWARRRSTTWWIAAP